MGVAELLADGKTTAYFKMCPKPILFPLGILLYFRNIG
jgi:hypothetical protein